jgi:hypothetical protein
MAKFIEIYYCNHQAMAKALINVDNISEVWISEVSENNYLVKVETVTHLGDRLFTYVGNCSLAFGNNGHFDKDIAEELYNELKEILNS